MQRVAGGRQLLATGELTSSSAAAQPLGPLSL